MQQLSEGNETTELLTAQQLLDLTLTDEERFERDRQSVLTNLMTSMVQVATNQGAKEYSAALNPKFDKNLLVEISKELSGLGYRIETTEVDDPNHGTYSNLLISWSPSEQEIIQDAVESETN